MAYLKLTELYNNGYGTIEETELLVNMDKILRVKPKRAKNNKGEESLCSLLIHEVDNADITVLESVGEIESMLKWPQKIVVTNLNEQP